MTDEEIARQFVEHWFFEATQIALRSLDPNYLDMLRANTELARVYADHAVQLLVPVLREVREAGRREGPAGAA